MKIIDAYIGQNVLAGIFIVLIVLVGLFVFFSFIEEVDDIGKQSYDTWQALQYVLLEIPQHIYDLLPTAVLLGSLLGLGSLANNSELVVIRASGVSIGRIAFATMKMGLSLTLVGMMIGEIFAPQTVQHARNMRAVAQSEQNYVSFNRRYGFWARDGHNFINIRTILIDGGFGGATLYELDDHRRIHTITHANIVYYQGGQWLLEQAEQDHITAQQVVIEHLPRTTWKAILSPELVSNVIIDPYKLSSLGLYKHIDYLKKNEQNSAKYELAFWTRLSYPLVSIAMIFIAIPFVFGSLRTVSIGQRVLVGALLGIGFYMLNQMASNFALVYEINPLVSALLPPLTFLGLATFLFQRII
ncbi:MAG: LPS export ABC transporter permease LptG [Beggiatoa sp. IS2]|nr:MAG: LPS export ABC transporter permease LptG [Beggiatoa sp. IS2]